MKISKKEIGLAFVLTLFIATFAAYVKVYVGGRPGGYGTMLPQSLYREDLSEWSLGTDEHVKEMRQTIQAELEKGAFKPVVIQLEVLTEEMGGFVYSEYLSYGDGLWSGDMVSKIPQKNMSSFAFESESIISANGTVTAVTVSIRDITEGYTEEEVPYATVTIVLNEVAGAKPPEPFVQVWSVMPLLVTGLVWIAEGLIVGVPLCFVSLGVVLLVKRGIIPVWKRQLREPK